MPPLPEPALAEKAVGFEPVAEAHFPMLRAWLVQPHWREWWGDAEEEFRLIAEAMENREAEGFIAAVGGRPAAYIQSWRPTKFDEPWAQGFASGTLGVDISIGDAADLNRGLGPRILRAFAAKLFADGACRLVIDPDAANLRAMRAYRKAGFRPYDLWLEPEGTTLLMELFPRDLQEAP